MTINQRFRLGFILMRPTQFEAPFFKFISQDESADVTVLYLGDTGHGPYDPELKRNVNWGFDLYDGYHHNKMPVKGWLRWLLKEIEPSSFDAVIINGYYTWPLLCATVIAKMRGIKVALRLDSVEYDQGGNQGTTAKKCLKKLWYRMYDHFFAVSSLTAAFLQRNSIQQSQISYFTYAVDTDHFDQSASLARQTYSQIRSKWGIPINAKVVLAVTKLSPRETPWDLFRAFEKLENPNAFLFIVGDGPDRDFVEQFATEHLNDHVAFAGYIPYRDLPLIYAVADLYVHAASDEPWGVSIAEAMSCGLPVITSSRVGAGYDLVVQGENGFLYEFGNPDDLTEKIKCVLANFDSQHVVNKNREILSSWDYRASWRNILRFYIDGESQSKYLNSDQSRGRE